MMSLEQCISAWLDEKTGLSESDKTHAAYQETLTQFRDLLTARGLDLDAATSLVFPLAQGWAGSSTVGRMVAPSTYNQRLAILSSFYEYAIRADVLERNPITKVKRRKLGEKDRARALKPAQVKEGLHKIDRDTPEGLRDYALLSVALTTGHRASELAGLRLKHVHLQGETCVVTWARCKGNEAMESTLEKATTTALYAYLTHPQVYGTGLLSAPGESPVWLSVSKRNEREAIGPRTISNMCKEFLGSSKVHTTRHTAAVRMHHAGAKLAEIGRFLGHKNLKTTSDYMDEQLGYENKYASDLESEFGI